MHVLITGASGFVAPYIAEALRQGSDALKITLSARNAVSSAGIIELDVEDAQAVQAAVVMLKPTRIVHLAAISSPAVAGDDPDQAWRINLGGTLNIARALLRHAPSCTLLFAGSGQVYGETAKLNRALTEADVLAPNGDYAVTKAAADLALGALSKEGLRCIRLRPFNHTGPGQTEDFVLPSFAAQIARIEAGSGSGVIRVGNLDVERDFLDVRDVAEAYARAVFQADSIPTGTIFNIASGQPRSIRELLEGMLALSSASIKIEQDPARMRPSDTPCFYGDASRARNALGWVPQRQIDDMLRELLDAARRTARSHPESDPQRSASPARPA